MSNKPNDGGQFHPPHVVFTPQGSVEKYEGVSLRALLASMEGLHEWDMPEAIISKPMGEALAGCKQPEGGWSKAPLEMCKWEAKWRAALKLIRADALISELEKEVK